MALIVYIPQSPHPALTFFLRMYYMSLSYYACLGELGTVQAQHQMICTWGLILWKACISAQTWNASAVSWEM